MRKLTLRLRKLNPFVITAFAAFCSVTGLHAQGLGGLGDKLKSKVPQSVDAAQTTSSASQLPANGEDPPSPSEMTPATEARFTTLLLSDTRPVVRGQNNGSYTNWYRQARQLQNVNIRYTWTDEALAKAADVHFWLFTYVEDFSNDLVSGLNANNAATLRPLVAKIKEIHFATTDKENSLDMPGTEQGWYFSFNSSTGVLTAAFTDQVSSVAAWHALDKFIETRVR